MKMNWLSKFFLTHSFGSVGSIAKWMAVNYTKVKEKFPKKTHRELLLHLIELRYPNGKAIIGPEQLPESSMAIIEKCQGSLEKVTMYIEHLEHKELDEIKITRPYLYMAVKKIVRERLNKFAPDIKEGSEAVE